MKKIYLKWARPLGDTYFNFGDDLNPYLIEKLSGTKTQYIHFAEDRIDSLKLFIALSLKGQLNFGLAKNFITSIFAKKYVLCIGSILNWYSSKRAIVWGAGIIDRKYNIKPATYLAVRGTYTLEKVRELGISNDVKLGDPGLLTPLVYDPSKGIKKKYKLGVIPHITHFEEVTAQLSNSKSVHIINLNNSSIEAVIDEFLMCEKIISTSLHGLIIANSFGIEALWMLLGKKPLSKDNVKFYDYFSSVNIPEYEPFSLDIIGFNEEFYLELFELHKDKSTIKNDLNDIQQELLSVAPFKIKSEFLK
jgi:pyruvyltransferase